jgi:hypothetical protein
MMQDIHPGLRLSGPLGQSFFDISEDLLAYIGSVLQNQSPMAPAASVNQWLALLDVLKSHWIIPLLYRQIGCLPKVLQPPESAIDEMRKTFLLSRVRSLHMAKQLREIIDAFRDKNLRVLVLRGPGLAWSVYPDPALRPSCDLDLLVLPEHAVRARGILESLGYKCLAKRFEVTRDFFREEEFIHQENPRDNLVVDLHWIHWELSPFFESEGEVRIEDLFHRATKVESSGLRFETLHPVDGIIHGAIHTAMIHKRDMRLIWIYDTALLARQLEVPHDWEILQQRSVTWGARLPLEHCLRLAQIWAGLTLPAGFSDFSTWPRPNEDERAIWADTMKHHWVTILLKRSLRNPSMLVKRVPSLFHLLFPHPDVVRFCYPPSRDCLLALSYLRRWHRWLEDLVVKRIGLMRQRG